MNRITTAAAGIIVGGFACLTLSACQTDVGGIGAAASSFAAQLGSAAGQQSMITPQSGGPAGSIASSPVRVTMTGSGQVSVPVHTTDSTSEASALQTTTADPTTSDATADSTDTNSTTTDSTNTDSTTSDSTQEPTTSATHASTAPAFVSLTISCTYDASQVEYREFVDYELANATALAVSVDNQGLVGAYGTSDSWHGTYELPNLGCYSANGEQIYDFDTVGSTGTPAHKEIKRTGTHHQGDTPTTTGTDSAPSISKADLECTKKDDGSYDLTLSYRVEHATGVELSVDNPGVEASFGTYDGPQGTIDVPDNACYSDGGEHQFTLYTVGGTGQKATKTLNYSGTHHRPGSSTSTSSDDSTSSPDSTSSAGSTSSEPSTTTSFLPTPGYTGPTATS